MAHSEQTKQEVLNMYLKDNQPTRMSQITGISKRTIDYWIAKGELTNGEPWNEYRERLREVNFNKTRTLELVEKASDDKAFLERVKQDLERIVYKGMIEKFEDGNFDVRPSDLVQVVNLYNTLQNGAAEKEAFAAWWITVVGEIAHELMDARQFQLFQDRVKLRSAEVSAKLNPLGLAATLPVKK